MGSTVETGSTWATVTGERFFVMTKTKKNDLVWVVYRKENSFDTYSCLESSFLKKFTKVINQSNVN